MVAECEARNERAKGSRRDITASDKSDAATLSEPQKHELSAHVARGLGWKGASQVAVQGTRLVVMVALARLLTPHEFGLAGMALVLAGFVIPFADMGLGAALVQRRSLTEDDRSTAFWASLSAGVVFTAVALLAAPYIADFYGHEEVEPLIKVLALSFVITSIGSTQRSLLVRAMDFRSLELRYIGSTVGGGAVAIALAFAGAGAWALVGQELALALLSTVLLWFVVPWRPGLHFSRASLRALGGFGVPQLGGAYFTSLTQNTDNLLVGRFLGTRALGFYAFAYNLMLVPVTRIVGPIQQVIFPAMSRLQDDPRSLAELWVKSNRVIAAVCGPMLGGLIIAAPDLIPLVFGQKWHDAVPIVQVLSWVGIVFCLQTLNDSVLQARGAVTLYFRFQALAFAINLAAFVIGLEWGVVGVAAAFAVSSTLLFVAYAVVTTRVAQLNLQELARGLAGIFIALVGMATAALLVRNILLQEDASHVIRLIATVAAGVAAYATLLAWWAPDVIDEGREFLRGRRLPSRQRPRFDTQAGTTP
jgi:O-antigen/teichoic acid export membrane protein